MNDINEVYYDEHIKSHQRHILISWLESAKSERIKAVKEKVKIHAVKVNVPDAPVEMIEIPEQTEEDKKAINKLFDGILTGVDLPEAVYIAEQTDEEKAAMQQKFAPR